MPRPRFLHFYLIALAFLPAAPACAQLADSIKFNAGLSRQFDSNLFRLPSQANVNALVGRSSAAEEIDVTSLGANFNKAYGLQRVELGLTAVGYAFRNFSYLGYMTLNYDAAWRWSLTPRFHGNLTARRLETPNSFDDTQGSTRRNLRTEESARLDGEYELGGPWALRAGVTQSTQTNEQTILPLNEFRATAVDLGARYLLASGSSLSYGFVNTKGQNLSRGISAAHFVDDGYSQSEHQVSARWIMSGKTSADFNASQLSRVHPKFPQRDYSGLTAGAVINLSLTGKSAVSASWARELSSNQTATASFVQTDRFSIAPVWQISSKALVRLRYDLAQRDYSDLPTAPVPLQRKDTTQDASVSMEWQPYQFLVVSASLLNTKRSANLAGLDYESNVATLSAQLSY